MILWRGFCGGAMPVDALQRGAAGLFDGIEFGIEAEREDPFAEFVVAVEQFPSLLEVPVLELSLRAVEEGTPGTGSFASHGIDERGSAGAPGGRDDVVFEREKLME